MDPKRNTLPLFFPDYNRICTPWLDCWVEISFSLMVLALTHDNIFSFIYILLLILMVFMRRRNAVKWWPFLTMAVTSLIIVQYILFLRFYPPLCVGWFYTDNVLKKKMINFFGTFYNNQKLLSRKLIIDCLLLVAVVYQLRKIYSKDEKRLHDVAKKFIFDEQQRKKMEIIKYTMVISMWTCSAVAFITGFKEISVFSFGYLFTGFIIIFVGRNFLVWRIQSAIFACNCFLSYNVFVVLLKMTFHTAGCFFNEFIPNRICTISKLFIIICRKKYSDSDIDSKFKNTSCSIDFEENYLMWDIIYFITYVFLKHGIYTEYYLLLCYNWKMESLFLTRSGERIIEQYDQSILKKFQEQYVVHEKVKTHEAKIKQIQKKHFQRMPFVNHYTVIYTGEIYHENEVREDSFIFKMKPDDFNIIAEEKYYTLWELYQLLVNYDFSEVIQTGGIRKKTNITDEKSTKQKNSNQEAVPKTVSGKSRLQRLYEKIVLPFKFTEMFIKCTLCSIVLTIESYTKDYYDARVFLNARKQAISKQINATSSQEEVDELAQKIAFQEFTKEEEEIRNKQKVVSLWLRLAEASYYLHLTTFTTVCFILAFTLMMLRPSLLTLPLPLMVFLWGSLSIPEPSSRFWNVMLFYTTMVLFIRVIFQLKIFKFNEMEDMDSKTFYITRAIGIEKYSWFQPYEVMLLLAVLYKRSVLQRIGMWHVILDEKTAQKSTTFSATNNSSTIKSKQIVFTSSDSFIKKLFAPRTPSEMNYYPYFIFCDIMCVVMFILGSHCFTKRARTDTIIGQFIEENRIPTNFIYLLLFQVVVVITKRSLFLCRTIKGNVIFHIVVTFFVHGWLFFYIPFKTSRQFNECWTVIGWYIFFSIYLLLAAAQIKVGYPTMNYSIFFCRNYTNTNAYISRAFRNMPFLFDLSTLLNWLWANTSLTVWEWFYFEEIFKDVFESKCFYLHTKRFPYMPGQPVTFAEKVFDGYIYIILLIILTLLPFYLYYLRMATFLRFIPFSMKIFISVNTGEMMYSAETNEINLITSYSEMIKNDVKYDDFEDSTMQMEQQGTFVAIFRAYSTNLWLNENYNPGVENFLHCRLLIDGYIKNMRSSSIIDSHYLVKMPHGYIHQILTLGPNDSITVSKLLPKVIYITNSGTLWGFSDIIPYFHATFKRVGAILSRVIQHSEGSEKSNTFLGALYKIYFNTDDQKYKRIQAKIARVIDDNEHRYSIYIISKRFSKIGEFDMFGFSIFAIIYFWFYIKYILMYFDSTIVPIYLSDLAYVDRILRLCIDIHIARDYKSLVLEEALFAKLLHIYRSPHLLVKWSQLLPAGETDVCEQRPKLEQSET